MRRIFFAFVTFLFITCGGPSLPEYNLISIEEPKVSSTGYISPTQNLVYNIEIDNPLQKDSLELLQYYFINKGKKDFVGVSKVIVRVYLKGTSLFGIPYASLNLIGDKKEININENALKLDSLTNNLSTQPVQEVNDPFIGKYFCNRTHDTYVFKSDNTGFFTIQGGSPSEFTWKRSGNDVTIKYEAFGEEKLKYDSNSKTITEESESFGTMIFTKQ